MKNKKGFTLVELLVVIAIIGILSSVAVVNLNSARSKAKQAAALASISGLGPAIILCLDSTGTTNIDSSNALNTGNIGGSICSGTAVDTVWPAIKDSGYRYNNNGAGVGISSTQSTGVYSIKIFNTTTGISNITCSNTGCVVAP